MLTSKFHDAGSDAPASANPAYLGRVKYTPAAAARYQIRKAGKHRAEMKLITRALAGLRRGSVLDVPCGGGRVSLLLAQQGYQPTAADLSSSMVEIASEAVQRAPIVIPVQQRDIEALDYSDRSFDGVICFRLFHHFPNREIRAQVAAELCRVARTWVALSYFSPWSFTSAKRSLEVRWLGRGEKKFPTPLKEVAGYFAPHGFRLVRDYAQLRCIHTLHLALFQRED